MARVDYTDSAGAYRRARTLPPQVLAAWRDAVVGLELPLPARVLDLGAGPGGFLDPLREWFGAPVVAIEPSEGMRSEAVSSGLADRYPCAAAVAEALPLCDGSVDVAWLSTVIHQFDDRDRAIAELGRVVRPGGHVLVRGFFAEGAIGGFFAAFPGIDRAAGTFPATADIVAAFAAHGFVLAQTIDVPERWEFEPAAWIERAISMRHTDSAFRPLTDDEFDAGIRNLRAQYEGVAGPIVSETPLRMLVLERLDD